MFNIYTEVGSSVDGVRMIREWLIGLKVKLGYEVCPKCGSSNIIKRGFDGYNLRYDCKDCGTETYVEDLLCP